MTIQPFRIVNLTKKEVLDPKFLGSYRDFEGVAFTPVAGALIWLLSRDWSGDQVALVSENTRDEDLPASTEVCGIPASQLYAPQRHGHERFKPVTKKCREALSSYGWVFTVTRSTTTSLHATVTSRNITWDVPGSTDRFDALNTHDRSFEIVNHTKGQRVSSDEISSEGSIGSAILNLSSLEEIDSAATALPVILALLLMASGSNEVYVGGDEEFAIDCSLGGFGGSWAGDHVSVVVADPALDGVRIAYPDPEEVPSAPEGDISEDLIRAISASSHLVEVLCDWGVPIALFASPVPSVLGGIS